MLPPQLRLPPRRRRSLRPNQRLSTLSTDEFVRLGKQTTCDLLGLQPLPNGAGVFISTYWVAFPL